MEEREPAGTLRIFRRDDNYLNPRVPASSTFLSLSFSQCHFHPWHRRFRRLDFCCYLGPGQTFLARHSTWRTFVVSWREMMNAFRLYLSFLSSSNVLTIYIALAAHRGNQSYSLFIPVIRQNLSRFLSKLFILDKRRKKADNNYVATQIDFVGVIISIICDIFWPNSKTASAKPKHGKAQDFQNPALAKGSILLEAKGENPRSWSSD